MEKQRMIELVTKAQSGDQNALNDLFNESYNDVYYFALKTVKDEELACDITQETFMEIIKSLHTLKEPAAFFGWTRQVAFSKATRYFNKKKDVLVEEDEEGFTLFDNLTEEKTEFIPDEALEQDEFKKIILFILDTLSEEQRSAIMMYYFDELSIREIADIQGVSEGTVKSRLNYGRKAVKTSVEVYEKNHNIKLHAIPFFHFFKWLMADSYQKGMPFASAQEMAKALSESTGASLEITASEAAAAEIVSGDALVEEVIVGGDAVAGAGAKTAGAETAGAGAKTAASLGKGAAKTAVGTGAAKAGIPLAAKIIAGVLAAAILIGGVTTAVVVGVTTLIVATNNDSGGSGGGRGGSSSASKGGATSAEGAAKGFYKAYVEEFDAEKVYSYMVTTESLAEKFIDDEDALDEIKSKLDSGESEMEAQLKITEQHYAQNNVKIRVSNAVVTDTYKNDPELPEYDRFDEVLFDTIGESPFYRPSFIAAIDRVALVEITLDVDMATGNTTTSTTVAVCEIAGRWYALGGM